MPVTYIGKPLYACRDLLHGNFGQLWELLTPVYVCTSASEISFKSLLGGSKLGLSKAELSLSCLNQVLYIKV